MVRRLLNDLHVPPFAPEHITPAQWADCRARMVETLLTREYGIVPANLPCEVQ